MSDESLLAGDDTQNDEVTTETTADPWYMSEGVAGEGDVPEWYKADKFKSVSAQAEAYKGLESKLGGFTGSPDAYELSMPDGVEGEFVEGDTLMEGFQSWAKESGLSQDKFTELLHMYVKNEHDVSGTSREDQLALMGDNADKRLGNVDAWAKANLDKGEYESMLEMTSTAAGVQLIESMIAKTRTPKIPTGDGVADTGLTHAEVKERMNDPRYKSDPAFRKETSRMYEKVFGTGERKQVVG